VVERGAGAFDDDGAHGVGTMPPERRSNIA
jgi:hypothetical protein